MYFSTVVIVEDVLFWVPCVYWESYLGYLFFLFLTLAITGRLAIGTFSMDGVPRIVLKISISDGLARGFASAEGAEKRIYHLYFNLGRIDALGAISINRYVLMIPLALFCIVL